MRRVEKVLAVLVTASVLVLGPFTTAVSAAPAGVTSTEVSFVGSGGVVLHGTILAPRSGAVRRPGLVMLEGAGNRGRSYLRPEAEEYARHGVVTLSYDKRVVGYSLLHRDYGVLADDALAALRLLRARSDVDPASVGLWALSEGAFVAPLAAARSADVAFLITVGAVGVTPAAQTAWEYGQYLRHEGITGRLVRTLQTRAVGTAIDAGLFPEADFDPVSAWRRVRQPVLAEWGQFDRDSVPQQSSRLIGAALGGSARHTIRFVRSVNHNLHVTADGGFDRLPAIPAEYADYETAWIARSSPVPAGAEASLTSEPAAPYPTRGGARWALAVAALILAVGVGFPLAGVVRRGARTRSPKSARWLAVLAPFTVVGTLGYLLFLLATAGKVTGAMVAGRPVPWLILQVLAVGTVAAAGAVALSWRRPASLAPAGRVRMGVLTVAGLLFVPWAVYWGLLLP